MFFIEHLIPLVAGFYLLNIIYTCKDNTDLLFKALFDKPRTVLLNHKNGLKIIHYKLMDKMKCKNCNRSKCMLVREFKGKEDLICAYCMFCDCKKQIYVGIKNYDLEAPVLSC